MQTLGTSFNADCLDFLYADGGDDDKGIADGTRYALIGPPRGLGSKVKDEFVYLIL